MYLSSSSGSESAGFSGLSATDEELLQQSRSAIKAALDLNPVGGYVAGSSAARALEAAFDSVPPCKAPDLAKELSDGQTALARLFGYRLATPTRQRMLDKLIAKANVCLAQQAEERRKLAEEIKRREEQERLRNQAFKQMCDFTRQTELLVEQVCQRVGENSPICRQQRDKLRQMQEDNRKNGIFCNLPQSQLRPSPGSARLSGYGLGQLPSRRGPTLLPPNMQLRMPPHETIEGFARDAASLSSSQIDRVNRVADFIARSWTTASPITSVRLTGYINRDEWQSGLGARRATAVRDALISALNRLRPGLVTRINWTTEDRGFSMTSKVEIYLWAGPTAPPVPPLVRLPSPAEAARTIVPLGPETAEQRIQRILRELPPAPPPRRSFNQMFWQRVDEQLNATMSRLNIPRSLRPHIRDGVHAAIRRGSEALLNEIVGTTRLPSEVQEAIRTTARALLDVPVAR